MEWKDAQSYLMHQYTIIIDEHGASTVANLLLAASCYFPISNKYNRSHIDPISDQLYVLLAITHVPVSNWSERITMHR